MSVQRLGLRSIWMSSTQNPSASEDLSIGYRGGDVWVRSDTSRVWVLTDDSAGTWTELGGGFGAPTTAQYVTLATDATLTSERVLTAGALVDIVDAGAGGAVTIDVDLTEAGAVTPSVDTKAIIVDGSSQGYAGPTAIRLAHLRGRMGTSIEKFDPFLTPPTISNITSLYGDLLVTASGAGAAIAGKSTTETKRAGILELTTGTTSTGRIAVHTFRDGIRLGGGPWTVAWGARPTTLSDGTQTYAMVVGLVELVTGLTQADGCYFLYDTAGTHTGSTASANWWAVTANGSSRTFTDTGVAVSTTTWADLEVRVNAAATSVAFVINGSTVATHTTDIPTSASNQVSVGAALFKSAGTTARTVDLDYYGVIADLS